MEVLCTSPWVPPEWIKAHGLEPRGAWLQEPPHPVSAPEGVCLFAQTMANLAGATQESAVVFTTACDQMRRAADAAAFNGASRVFLFNLPATWQTPVATRMFADELKRLGRFCISLGGREPSGERLSKVMDHYNAARRRLREAARWCPARPYADAVARFHRDGSVELPPPSVAERPAGGIAVAMVGGPLPCSQMALLEAIERAGGRVVLNATEGGERSLGAGSTAPHEGEDAVERLARDCLVNCVDVFQRPNTRLYDWLRERLAARGARGIVLWQYVGCDLWRAEAQPLREAFGLPVLLLEADGAALARNTGRLEAFLESLR